MKIQKISFLAILVLNASCASNQKSKFETRIRAGIEVKDAYKIEGVTPERGLIYKYNERYPWMELKYYCRSMDATLNFTIEASPTVAGDWIKFAQIDADRWCMFNGGYSINGIKHSIEINGVQCPIFECVENDTPSEIFYFTSVPLTDLQARLVTAVYTTDATLSAISSKMSVEEIKLAVIDLITSKEFKRKVRLVN